MAIRAAFDFQYQYMIRIPMDDISKNFLSEASQEPTPYDCSDLSVDAIVSLIHTVVNCRRDNGNSRNDAFYAGICKDVKDNMQRHGNDSYVGLVDCGTREKAGEVETRLDELGFDVGKKANNGGDEETTIVYVIKKDRDFKR